MTDSKDFFTLNGIDLDKAYQVTVGARGGKKLFFFEQLCIKQREEINRQKEEIERLKVHNTAFAVKNSELEYDLELLKQEKSVVKSEAYKEFAERLKEEITQALRSNYEAKQERLAKHYNANGTNEFVEYCNGKIDCLRGIKDFIDNLLKELEGEQI